MDGHSVSGGGPGSYVQWHPDLPQEATLVLCQHVKKCFIESPSFTIWSMELTSNLNTISALEGPRRPPLGSGGGAPLWKCASVKGVCLFWPDPTCTWGMMISGLLTLEVSSKFPYPMSLQGEPRVLNSRTFAPYLPDTHPRSHSVLIPARGNGLVPLESTPEPSLTTWHFSTHLWFLVFHS